METTSGGLPRPSEHSSRTSRSIAIALQTAGTLSALIFLISSIYEVLSINSLYQSQRFLIGLLLGTLALWALLEVQLVARRRGSPPLRSLQAMLVVQLALVPIRQWISGGLQPNAMQLFDADGTGLTYRQAVIFLPIYFLTFLAISHFLISAFSHSEAQRSRELSKQMQLLYSTKAALEESESRYRTFFNLPLVGTAIISRGRNWIAFNNETCHILGYHHDQLLDKSWFELVHQDDLADTIANFDRLLQGVAKRFEHEQRFLRRDGTIVHALVAGGCGDLQEPADATPIYLNLIDITDRKRAEAELLAAQEREKAAVLQRRALLEQKLKTSLTAAAVAHEIQQPLAAILLNSRLASEILAGGYTAQRQADALLPQLQDKLLALTADGERVSATMERMRMLLRNVETAHTTVDLAAGIHSSLVFMRNHLLQHQVQVDTAGLNQSCEIQGDSAQLQIAVVNLIRNAIQALECQPPARRRLLVTLQHQPDRLDIRVADSGPGFPESFSNDTSWKLLKSTKATGMGLGLFLAQTAATNHRGQLRIGRSAELGGAEVLIELPLSTT